MQIKVVSDSKSFSLSDFLLVGFFENEPLPKTFVSLDKPLGPLAEAIIKKENYKASLGKNLFFYAPIRPGLKGVLALGLGKRTDYKLETAREAVGRGIQEARVRHAKCVLVILDTFKESVSGLESLSEAMSEALSLSLYRFNNYKKSHDEENLKYPAEVLIFSAGSKTKTEIQAGVSNAQAIAESVKISRDLTNTPSNKMNPKIFSQSVRVIARKYRLTFKLLEKKDLIREKMNAILAVGQGSHVPPRMIVLSYNEKRSGAPVCIIGKGVTFDSGGISIKPSANMDKMKYDMAGGGVVVGILAAASRLKLPVKLIGIIPLAENMPGGGAIKPGDVVTSASGLSIEIKNTDAEGRLLLADALHYAKRFKPKAIFDFATLTGAVLAALGSRCMAALGDNALITRLKRAGESVNERIWELPMFKEYEEDIKSSVADMKNVGEGEAGTIIGAKFLEKFVEKNTPWVHLDIAGTAWVEKKAPSYCPKGARGIGVRLFIEYLRREAK